jgi:hypothetical protein
MFAHAKSLQQSVVESEVLHPVLAEHDGSGFGAQLVCMRIAFNTRSCDHGSDGKLILRKYSHDSCKASFVF